MNEGDELSPWERFASGHWVKDMPLRAGRYPTATRDGLCAEDISVVELSPGRFQSVLENTVGVQWRGYWWSEPYPQLPKPPAW